MFTRMIRSVLGPARDPLDRKVYHVLSQLGMVRHGWQRRRLRGWKPRIAVNAAAFLQP